MSRTCVWPWNASSRAGFSVPSAHPVRARSAAGATAQRRPERGSVLVISMLILVLLSLVGVMATTTSHFEIQLAGNTKFQKGAFFHTDSAVYATPKVITAVIETNEDDPIPALPGGAFLDADPEDFRKELVLDNRWDPEPDIAWPFGPVVDVRRMGQVPLPGGGGGGGVEFLSMSGSAGGGGGGSGYAIYYDMESTGRGVGSARSRIYARYQNIPGVPGGL